MPKSRYWKKWEKGIMLVILISQKSHFNKFNCNWMKENFYFYNIYESPYHGISWNINIIAIG